MKKAFIVEVVDEHNIQISGPVRVTSDTQKLIDYCLRYTEEEIGRRCFVHEFEDTDDWTNALREQVKEWKEELEAEKVSL